MAGESITVQAVIDSAPAVAGAQQYNRAVSSMRDATSGAASQLDKMTGATGLLRASLGTLSAAFAVKGIVEAADAYTILKTKLETITGSSEAGASALSKIKQVAKDSRTSSTDLADAFSKMAVGLKENNISQDTAISSLGTLSKAMQLSGASTDQTREAMDGYANAFIRGRFEGRQFLGLMQDMPLLMQKLQQSTGASSEQIRRWSLDGKFTAQTVQALLASMASDVDSKFAAMPRTVGGSIRLLGETITKVLGQALSDSGTSTSRLVDAFDKLRVTINSPDFKSGARAIADALGSMLDGIGRGVSALNADMGKLSESFRAIDWDDKLSSQYGNILKFLFGTDFGFKAVAASAAQAKTGISGFAAALAPLSGTQAAKIGPWQTSITAATSDKVDLSGSLRETDREKAIKREIELEGIQARLARARALDDKDQISTIELQLQLKQRITQELVETEPKLALQLMAEIRLTEEAKRRSQILQENRQLVQQVGTTLSDSIISAAKSGDSLAQSFRNVLAQMIEMIAKATILKPLIESMSRSGGSALSAAGFNAEQGVWGGLLGGSSNVAGSAANGGWATTTSSSGFLGSLFGFANGGSFQVGGSGGTDSQMVAFRASPDERVTITRPDQQGNTSAPGNVNVNITITGDATDETVERMRSVARQEFAQQMPRAVNASVDAVRDRNVRDRNYLRR
jgi:tape measure domain-containing protein